MAADKTPYVPPALVDFLEKKFLDRCPRLDIPERVLWHDVGAVSVVRYLRRLVNEQVKSPSE